MFDSDSFVEGMMDQGFSIEEIEALVETGVLNEIDWKKAAKAAGLVGAGMAAGYGAPKGYKKAKDWNAKRKAEKEEKEEASEEGYALGSALGEYLNEINWKKAAKAAGLVGAGMAAGYGAPKGYAKSKEGYEKAKTKYKDWRAKKNANTTTAKTEGFVFADVNSDGDIDDVFNEIDWKKAAKAAGLVGAGVAAGYGAPKGYKAGKKSLAMRKYRKENKPRESY